MKSLHRFASLGLKSRIDARWHCDDDLQAKPFFFAATKNRIGRGPRCRYDCSRRNHSSSRQRKLGSDADLVAATTVAGETILLRGSEEWNRTRTSLQLRLLQAEPFSLAATKIRIGRGTSQSQTISVGETILLRSNGD